MTDNNDSDANFNDAELQDIMSEIESLEKEFVEDEEQEIEAQEVVDALEDDYPVEIQASTEVTPAAEEDDIVSEADIESITQDMVNVQKAEEQEENNVAELQIVRDEQASSAPVSATPGTMSFQGSGKLDLALNFFVGDQQATLKVVDGEGLTVDMAGTTLTFDANGCQVNIEGGANISLPLNSIKSAKKAA